MNKAKRLLSALLILLIFSGVISSAMISVNAADTDTSFQIKIIHTNDIHARVQEDSYNKIIGFAKLKTVIDTFNEDADIAITADSGDLFHGQPVATLSQGEAVARLVKECGYDVMTSGNHDWSYGKDRLKELAEEAGLDIIAGNVTDENGKQFFDKEFCIKEISKNGKKLKVGMFGIIDPKIYHSTAPDNVAGLTFTDMAEYANKAAAELKSMDCDIVIALSHTYSPDELAACVNDVDIWLCGHEHSVFEKTVQAPDGDTVYLFEDGYYLNSIGLIEVNCDIDSNGNAVNIECSKSSVAFDDCLSYSDNQAVSELLNQINDEQKTILAQPVGESPEDLDGVWEHLRIGDTNLGKAVANAYLLETGADIAFENAGGIRASVPKGSITYSDVIAVSPYGNYIVTKQISGKQLKEIMETAIDIQLNCIAANNSGEYDAWPKNSGSYLQFAGFTVTYNPSLEKDKRVISIEVSGEKLDESKLYTVATNNYLAVSSVYPSLLNASVSGEYDACDASLIRFFQQDLNVISDAVSEVGLIVTDKTGNTDDSQNSNDNQENNQKPNTADEADKTDTDTSPVKKEEPQNNDMLAPQTGEAEDNVFIALLLILGAVALLAPLSYSNRNK